MAADADQTISCEEISRVAKVLSVPKRTPESSATARALRDSYKSADFVRLYVALLKENTDSGYILFVRSQFDTRDETTRILFLNEFTKVFFGNANAVLAIDSDQCDEIICNFVFTIGNCYKLTLQCVYLFEGIVESIRKQTNLSTVEGGLEKVVKILDVLKSYRESLGKTAIVSHYPPLKVWGVDG